jgi:O-acetyl-ADP-ribose deacetylase (regulator of RNase III)
MSGERSSVKAAYRRMIDLNKKLMVKKLEYHILNHQLLNYIHSEIQEQLISVSELFDSEMVSHSNCNRSKIHITVASMDAEKLNILDKHIGNFCNNVTTDAILFKEIDLKKLNNLDSDEFKKQWGVKLIKQHDKICLYGVKDNVKDAKDSLMSILKNEDIKTWIRIPCRKLIYHLLMKKRKELIQIAKDNNAQCLEKQMNNRTITFKAFESKRDDITKSVEKLIFELEKEVQFRDMILSNFEYSVLHCLTNDIKTIKRKNTVSLMFPSDEQVVKATILTNSALYYISLKCTDIVPLKVDAIVNTTNQELDNANGLSKQISEKAGAEFNKECQEMILKRGMLNVGEAAITSAGNLKCRKIINVVGPKWSGGGSNEESLLRQAVYSCLDLAENNKLWNIAIPAISSGINNYPLAQCLQIIADAAFSYFKNKKPNHLRKCFLVTNKSEIALKWRDIFKNIATNYRCKDIIGFKGEVHNHFLKNLNLFGWLYQEKDALSNNMKIVLSGQNENIKQAENNIRSLLTSKIQELRLDMTKISKNLEGIKQLIQEFPDVEAIEQMENNGAKSVVLRGLMEKLHAAENKILKSEDKQTKTLNYPEEWETGQTANCVVYSVNPSSLEYIKIVNRLKATLPSCQVHKIERIQNKWLWKKYVNQREIIELKNNGNPNEMHLFHGTRNNPPENIYKDEVGFDMRYSAQGSWGRGCYFAYNASYSGGGYEYQLSSGKKQMFFARVAVGDAIQLGANSNITMPPVKSSRGHIASTIRYDAVNSKDRNIFIIYENSRAYPAYLITFS